MGTQRLLRQRLNLPLILFALANSISAAAYCQTSDDKAAADALFDAARNLMEAGDFKSACPKFKDSHDLDPAVGTLLNLGLCYKKADMTASAWSTYREAAALARQLGQNERESLARNETQALEKKLTRLIVEVSDEAATVPGLTISRGGKALRRTMWGVPLPVDPGDVVVEATAPGYAARKAHVKAGGEGKTLKFKIPVLQKKKAASPTLAPAAPTPQTNPEPLPPSAPQPATSELPADAGNETGSGPGAMPWILGGIGVAAVGTGAAFLAMGDQDNKNAEAICADQGNGRLPTGLCTQQDIAAQQSYTDEASAKFTVGYIGLALGGAALVGAGTWLLFFNDSEPSEGSAVRVDPLVGRSLLGLSAGGVF